MTRPRLIFALVLTAIVFSSFTCAKRSRFPAPPASTANALETASPALTPATVRRVNINTASAKELETLPGIGEGYAQRIVEYRQKYGPFGRPEHLMMVRGISDRRFRALRDLITIE